MSYNEQLRRIENLLYWLDANAKHAIELDESFKYPAHNARVREYIKGTGNARFYGICLRSIYFELVMTLMRIHDSYERDTACFSSLLKLITRDFVSKFKDKTNRNILININRVNINYKLLSGSHVMGKLKTVRHNMYAHTGTKFNREQVAAYGDAERLLEKTLLMLNDINIAIYGKPEPYDRISRIWAKYSREFWDNYINRQAAS
jgi:hypothetical protein